MVITTFDANERYVVDENTGQMVVLQRMGTSPYDGGVDAAQRERDLLEDRSQYEIDEIDSLVYRYYCDTVECIVERDYQPDFHQPYQIRQDQFPEIHTKVINDAFRINVPSYDEHWIFGVPPVHTFTILDYCDNAVLRVGDIPINFNICNVLDMTIDQLKTTITEGLHISPDILNTYTKKEVFELYACARVRDMGDLPYWYDHIADVVTSMDESEQPYEEGEDIIIVRD